MGMNGYELILRPFQYLYIVSWRNLGKKVLGCSHLREATQITSKCKVNVKSLCVVVLNSLFCLANNIDTIKLAKHKQ